MTLRGRIILLGLVAFAGLAILLGQNLLQFWHDYQRQVEFHAFVDRVAADVDVVHQLQRERGLTAAYLGEPGAEGAQAMDKQRSATDQAFLGDRAWTGAAEADGLLMHREQVTAGRVGSDESRWFYTRLIRLRLATLTDLATGFAKESQGRALMGHGALLLAKEYLGQMRAIVGGAYARRALTPRAAVELAGSYRLFQDSVGRFLRQAPKAVGDRYVQEVEASRDFQEVIGVVQRELGGGRSGVDSGDARAWYQLATRVIDSFYAIERDYFEQTAQLVVQDEAAARHKAILRSALLLLGTAVVLVLAVGTVRRMLAAVDRLLDGVSRIVEKRDFGLRLEEGPPFEVARISRGFNELLTIVDSLLAEKDYLAAVDPLTGIPNRTRFTTVAESELERLRRYGGTLSLVIFDVDRFKWINDRFGHSTGDAALRAIVAAVRGKIRSHDFLARWGGDEFVVLLPGSGIDSAGAVAEKLREAVAADAIDQVGAVSCTFGAAEYASGDCLESLFDRADRALYAAKRQGRNQVSVAGEQEPVPAAAPAAT